MLNRAAERRLDLGAADIKRLEDTIKRMRPAFEADNSGRYKLKIKRPTENVVVIYDTELGCVVSAWPGRLRFKDQGIRHG
jgi:hypothetical protein